MTNANEAAAPQRLRAMVIDDERLARKELRGLLAAHATAIDIAGEAESIEQAVAMIAELRPDVIFLDIQLSPGTGFDLLERIDHPVRVVFVTAFDAFALRAFEVNALDYLLKPINPQRLAQAVARLMAPQAPTSAPAAGAAAGVARGVPSAAASRSTSASTLAAGTPSAAANPVRPLTLDDRIFVEAHGRSRFLRVADVVCIAAEGDYSQVQSAGGQRWLVPKSLREWEERLPSQQFARIHRSMIVNLDCVDRLESVFSRGYRVYLRGVADPVDMSRRRAAQLKALFE